MADSLLGVRVVSVEPSSQAQLADLRPEDLIVRIGEREIHSIDEFAAVSQALKGRTARTTVLVFRNGSPRELHVHLYSYPLLDAWGIEFVPQYDLRFAEAKTGWAYWIQLGRGFEVAHRPAEALDAYLNALHHRPDDLQAAAAAAALYLRVSQQQLRANAVPEGIAALHRGVTMMDRLFSQPLTTEQLQGLRDQLEQTLRVLHEVTANLANQTAVSYTSQRP